ncbi:MAG: hypothetical protein N2110_09740 [Flavobacteriales bacterium]|nr:hypothetical protein [Flavobacteriales bacterium]
MTRLSPLYNFRRQGQTTFFFLFLLLSSLVIKAQPIFQGHEKIGETAKTNPHEDGEIISYGTIGNKIYYVCTGFLNNGFLHYYNYETKTNGRIPIKADWRNTQGYLAGVYPVGDTLYALVKISTPTKQQLFAFRIDLETSSLDKSSPLLLGEIAGAPQMLLDKKGRLVGKPVKNARDFIRANFGFSVSPNKKFAAVSYIKNFNGEKEVYRISIYDSSFNKIADHDVDDGFLRAANEYGTLKVDDQGHAHFVVERYNPEDGFFQKLHYIVLPPNDTEKVLKTSITFSGNIPARSNIFYQKEGLLFPRTKITKGNGFPCYVLRFDHSGQPIVAGAFSGVNGEYFIPQGYFLCKVKPSAKSSQVKFYSFDKTAQDYVNLLPTFWTFRDITFSKDGELGFVLSYSTVEAPDHYREVNKRPFKSALLIGTALANGKVKSTQAIPLYSQAFPRVQLLTAGKKIIGFFNDGEQNDGMTWNEAAEPVKYDDLITCHFKIDFTGNFKRGIPPGINPSRFVGLLSNELSEERTLQVVVFNQQKENFEFYKLQVNED